MPPLVTVLIPVYNCEQYIGLCIDSIINQTYNNIEILIINDGSEDGTEHIVKLYKNTQIRYVKNEKNLGIVKTLNKGLQLAEGEYIARMDADDIAKPDRIEKQLGFLQKNEDYSVVASQIDFIDEIGNHIDKRKNATFGKLNHLLSKYNCIAHPTVMYRKSIVQKYMYRHVVYEDYDLWLRLANDNYEMYMLEDTLLLFRIHGASITGNAIQSKEHFFNIAATKLFYYKNLGFSEKFKWFNLKLLMWYIQDIATAYYKKLKN